VNQPANCSSSEVAVQKALLHLSGVILVLSIAISAALPAAQFGPPKRDKSQQETDMEDRQIKALNQQRQKAIRDDTEKLFQLATELKAAVDKSNENLLSVDVVRKADEVERLARKVKEKMKDAIGPAPSAAQPLPLPTPH
jgi:hypothetical protein